MLPCTSHISFFSGSHINLLQVFKILYFILLMHIIVQVVEGDPVKLDWELLAHSLLFLGILFLCTKHLAPFLR
jgi:hypothetical protein